MFSAYILCTTPINKSIATCKAYDTLEEAQKNAKGASSYIIYPIPLPPPTTR